ncbi:MAG TPA: hypothetical protein VMB03_19730 [Bryobacteraceae bacterium]|nr:hypothetical protein [Bryobacteraceae bacterium]
MTPQALAAFATLVSFSQHGNRVALQLDRGAAELTWVSPSAFHFRRTLEGPLPPAPPEQSTAAVDAKAVDTPSAVHFRSKLLDVALQKRGLLVGVTGPGGTVLMNDLTEPKPGGWERQAPDGARFYGLGMLEDLEMDLSGRKVDSSEPFLISTAGYGEQHRADTSFDFTVPGRYRIQSPRVDYYFFYGPKPKDILKQRVPSEHPDLDLYRLPATWDGLRNRLVETVHLAMTSPFLPRLSFSGEDQAPAELKSRIHQLASLTPELPPFFDPSPFRRKLASFFDIYAIETRDKRYPVWHALPFEFPGDPECAHHGDEFMLGDEMLVAPIYEPGNKRQVYFPPGAWTDLETNRQFPGRRTSSVHTDRLPVFAHTGAIVPLDSPGDGIGLHYFPDLPGEFFILEKDLGTYSQIHAAPADDIMRLEIESRKDRNYRWIVHNVQRPASVAFEDRQYRWSYDAALRNLAIEVHVKAGEDNIVHVGW